MDNIKELWDSFVAAARDRTTNPLTFSFALSWGAWNYKFFMVLFSDMPVDDRIEKISEMYPHEWGTYLGGAFVLPLLVALAYVFVYPLIARQVVKYSRAKQVLLANDVKTIEGARLLTFDESVALTRKHEKELKKWKDDLSEANSTVTQLREALAAAEKQVSELSPATAKKPLEPYKSLSARVAEKVSPQIDSLSSEAVDARAPPEFEQFSDLREELIETLVELSRRSGPAKVEWLFQNEEKNYAILLSDLSELQSLGLVQFEVGPAGKLWALSEAGSKFIVQYLRRQNG